MTTRLVLVSLLLAAPVLAQDTMVGEKAPNFAGARIFHGDGRASLAEYEGNVVLVVFFCTICRTQWIEKPLEDLVAKYGAQGFAALGYLGGEATIDDATTEKARKYVEAMDFPVFFGADLSRPGTVEPFRGYRAGKRPHCFLIGADGRVAWRGEPGGVSIPEAEIQKALAARWERVVARHPGAPREVMDAIRAGRIARAYAAAREAGLDDLAAELGKQAIGDLERAGAHHDARRTLDAREIYESVARAWKGCDLGERADERLKEYKTSAMRKELAAWEKFRALEASLAGKDSAEASAAYATFARRNPGTAAAEAAAGR